MNSNSPVVSVVVCTYNQEGTIARTLDSILSQKTSYPFEIVLGEDSSSDGTRAVCEKYVRDYPSIVHLLPEASNKGLMVNYRDCLDYCCGEYIMACAGDDWWHNPHKIQMQVEALQNNEEYILCYTGCIRDNIKMNVRTRMPVVQHEDDLFGHLLKVDFICAPTVCYRKSALTHINYQEYLDRGYPMEDYPMWLEFANYGRFLPLDEYTVTYTHNSESASTFRSIQRQVDFESAVQRVRVDMVGKYGKESLYSESWLEDVYSRNLYSHGVKFNDRRFSLKSILTVHHKNTRDYMKILFACIPFLYKIVRKRNKEYASI